MHPQSNSILANTSFGTMSDNSSSKELENGRHAKTLSDRIPARSIILPNTSNANSHAQLDSTQPQHPHTTNSILHATTPQVPQRSLSHAHASNSHKSTNARYPSGSHHQHQFDFRQLKDNIAASDLPAWANWAVWNVEDRNAPRLPRYVYEHALCEQMDETTALAMYTNVFEESPLGTYTRPIVTSPHPLSSDARHDNKKHNSSDFISPSRSSSSSSKKSSNHKARFSREQEWEDLFKLPIGTQFVPQLVNTDHLMKELEDALPVLFKSSSEESESSSSSALYRPRTSSAISCVEDKQSR